LAYGLTNSADLEAGSSQYFSRADTASLSITGDYAVEAWIKLESLPTGIVYPICEKNDAGTNRSTNFVVQSTLLTIGVDQLGDNTDVSSVDFDWGPSTGVWYHVAGSFNSTTGRVDLFIDGSAVANATGTATAIFDGGASTYIGFQGGTSRFFDGRISLVRVWNTQRTAAQFDANKCVYFGAAESGMAAEWALDDVLGGSGLNDTSGNTNTLTNVNTVTFGADTPAVCAVAATNPLRRRMMVGIGA